MDCLDVGDLVEVKKDTSLSPSLRFFHNKKGMIKRLVSESCHGNKIKIREWEILFADGKRGTFKDFELTLVSSANKKN